MSFLAHRIVRAKKKNGRRKPASPETEPDFYKMASVPRKMNTTVIGSIGQDSVGLRTWQRPPGSFPQWSINGIVSSQGRNITEPREASSANLPQVPIPDLLAALIPVTSQSVRHEGETAEEEYRRQLLEPVIDFTF